MQIPVMTGTIRHRILLNYRIAPEIAAGCLPEPLQPKLVHGWAIGGICQVSLSHMRPDGLPATVGYASHNAAHRIAVLGPAGEGVYVPRRDTNSRLNQFASGRLFPGVYERSDFDVFDSGQDYHVEVRDQAGDRLMAVEGSVAFDLEPGSVFGTLEEGSAFFRAGSIGWSPGSTPGRLDTIELAVPEWRMLPFRVTREESAYFSDRRRFPAGSVEFDSAFIMGNLEHEWRALAPIGCAGDPQHGLGVPLGRRTVTPEPATSVS